MYIVNPSRALQGSGAAGAAAHPDAAAESGFFFMDPGEALADVERFLAVFERKWLDTKLSERKLPETGFSATVSGLIKASHTRIESSTLSHPCLHTACQVLFVQSQIARMMCRRSTK